MGIVVSYGFCSGLSILAWLIYKDFGLLYPHSHRGSGCYWTLARKKIILGSNSLNFFLNKISIHNLGSAIFNRNTISLRVHFGLKRPLFLFICTAWGILIIFDFLLWEKTCFITLCTGSGCGSVGRAVASYTRGLRFKSSHRQKIIYWTFIYCQLYWKDENKEKRGREWPIS